MKEDTKHQQPKLVSKIQMPYHCELFRTFGLHIIWSLLLLQRGKEFVTPIDRYR